MTLLWVLIVVVGLIVLVLGSSVRVINQYPVSYTHLTLPTILRV